MKLSPKGAAAIAKSEGVVTRAYRCPANVITIGVGYTDRSKAFRRYWRGRHGRDLRMGDTMTRKEALAILPDIVADEYGAAVVKALGGRKVPQHVFDACCSMVFNCGPGALRWKWFRLGVAKGDYALAAKLLRTTAVTANGKRLRGLVNRRAHEADMLLRGRYGVKEPAMRHPSRNVACASASTAVEEYQRKLTSLGFGTLVPDGKWGPASAAVLKKLQKAAGLKQDGILGPASRAEIDRRLKAMADGVTADRAKVVRKAPTPVSTPLVASTVTASTGQYRKPAPPPKRGFWSRLLRRG